LFYFFHSNGVLFILLGVIYSTIFFGGALLTFGNMHNLSQSGYPRWPLPRRSTKDVLLLLFRAEEKSYRDRLLPRRHPATPFSFFLKRPTIDVLVKISIFFRACMHVLALLTYSVSSHSKKVSLCSKRLCLAVWACGIRLTNSSAIENASKKRAAASVEPLGPSDLILFIFASTSIHAQ
jgi:hypothetical protein